MRRHWDAVFFDWDGTLADTHPLYWEITLTVGKRYGLAFSDDICEDPRFQLMTSREILAHHFAGSGLRGADAETLTTRAYRDMLELLLSEKIYQITLFPYALEILADARGHIGAVGLVTSSSREVMEATLTHLSLKKYFDLVITADDVKRHKPHPEPYRAARRRLNAERAIVVENTHVGIASGRGATATVVGIASSHRKEELRAAGAHYVAENHETLKWLLVALYLSGHSGLMGHAEEGNGGG